MNTIFIQNRWDENKLITKKDIINPKFECDIFINENKLLDNMKVKIYNNICINLKQNNTNLSEMFKDCRTLTSINLSNFSTNNVTDMEYMFDGCISLNSINLSNFNTNNVTNMRGMFRCCYSLTSINLSSFNTNNVTNMCEMF